MEGGRWFFFDVDFLLLKDDGCSGGRGDGWSMQGKVGMERAVRILEMWERLSAEDEENDGEDDGML